MDIYPCCNSMFLATAGDGGTQKQSNRLTVICKHWYTISLFQVYHNHITSFISSSLNKSFLIRPSLHTFLHLPHQHLKWTSSLPPCRAICRQSRWTPGALRRRHARTCWPQWCLAVSPASGGRSHYVVPAAHWNRHQYWSSHASSVTSINEASLQLKSRSCTGRHRWWQVLCSYQSTWGLTSPDRSHSGEVTVYVYDINQPILPTSFLVCSHVCVCLCGPFSCISFHKFSWQLSVFSLCSCGLISAFNWSFQLYISLWKSPSALI